MKVHYRKFLQKILLISSLWVSSSAPARAGTGLLMPMYGNTGFQFSSVYEAAVKVQVIAILNPDDGVAHKTL